MLSTAMLASVFYIIGVYIADGAGLSAVVFLCIMLFAAAIVKRGWGKMLFFAALAVLVGALRFGAVAENPLLRTFSDKYVTASGVIFSQSSASNGEYDSRFTMKMDELSYLGKSYKVRGVKVILNTKEDFKFGDRVKVSGFVSEISGRDNEFEYDFSVYCKSCGIYARIAAREAQKIGDEFSLSPGFLVGKLKSRAAERISASFSENRAAFLKAVLLNDKSGFDKEYKELLIRSGVYRSLYSPFVHISYMFLAAGIFCRKKKNREYVVLVMLTAYALLGSTSPTVVKACAVGVLMIFRKEIFGFADKLEVLSFVVLILLVADPMLCFNSGFVLSAAASVLVYFSYSPIYTWLFKLFSKRKINSHRLCAVCTMWIIFTVGTLPLCALFYNGVSIYSTLFSALLLPIPLISTVLSAPAIVSNGALFSAGVNIPFGIFNAAANFADRLPFSFLRLATPSFLQMAEFYLLWWIFLRAVSGKISTEKTKLLAVIFCAIGVSQLYVPNALSINFVNVGQGDGAVLQTPVGETIVIDGGGAPSYEDGYNVGEEVFVPYLVSHGFADIDVAILSHFHKDHAEGIIAAAKKLKIDTLVMPDVEPENEYRTEIEELSAQRGFKTEYLKAGDEIRFKSGLSIKFVAPNANMAEKNNLNDTSLVAHVRYGEFDALFTGDSGCENFAEYPQNIELLKVAHHGSEDSNRTEILAHLSPEYAVISVGDGNTYGLPNDSVLTNLARLNTNILRTDRLGDIRIRAKKDGSLTYNTLRG